MQTGWLKDAGDWYYLGPKGGDGAMKTGIVNVDGNSYYLDSAGKMKTGWIEEYEGVWIYCYSDGRQAFDDYVEGKYYISPLGT